MSISSPPRTFSPTHPSLISTSSAASNSSSSPEFEFSLLRNPSLHLLSADQLFSGGFLLPLHLLDISYDHNNPVAEEPVLRKDDDAEQPPRYPVTDRVPPDDDGGDKSEVTENKTTDAAATESVGTDTDVSVVPTVAVAASKRWKDIIFKKKVTDAAAAGDVEKGSSDQNQKKNQKIKKERVLSKRKETTRTNLSGSSNGGNSGELININLWPFSRSSSAGNNTAGRNTTTKAVMNRKVSSAPCSRSNSAGESNSSSKRWPRTAAAGFHIGKNPVWHVRKVGSSGRNHEASQPPPPPTNVINSSTNSTTTSDDDNGVEKVIEKDLEKVVDVKKDLGEESRRFGKAKSESSGGILGGGVLGGGGMKGLVMNLSVPMCMGYRSHSTHCRNGDLSPVVAGNGCDEAAESGGAVAAAGGAEGVGGGGAGGNMLNLRNLFTKRVH